VDQQNRPIPFLVPGPKADCSVGIAIAHFKAPLQDVVRTAQAAEKRAKRNPDQGGLGRSAVAVTLMKRSGEIIEWGAKWGGGLELYRESDRLTHLLVNEPFEDPRLEPRFCFPTPTPIAHRLPPAGSRAASEYLSTDARIELADVPFVPLRNRFTDLADLPGSFRGLIRRYSAQPGERKSVNAESQWRPPKAEVRMQNAELAANAANAESQWRRN
jgi:hypothetical protein